MRALALALLLTWVVPQQAAAQHQDTTPSAAEPVAIPHTEIRFLHSTIVGVDFTLFISLPWRYADSDLVYPVLYAPDANRWFAALHGIAHVLMTPVPETPERVIVAIGYPAAGSDGMADLLAGRTRDLTPIVDDAQERQANALRERLFPGRPDLNVRTGGAPTFLRFIGEELIPFVEANYRVSATDRGLGGYSYGGLFALCVLFEAPGTFHRIFAGSPSIRYGDGFLFRLEQQYADRHPDLPARLLITAGGLESPEMVGNARAMAERLRARGCRGLDVELVIFDGETHRSGMAAAWTRALSALYEEPERARR